MTCGVICLRGGTVVAFCCLFIMLFSCCTLGGVGVYGEIICNLVSDWIGMGGVMLSRLGGATVMGGVVTLGKYGANLGGETVCCCGSFVGTCCCVWKVAC